MSETAERYERVAGGFETRLEKVAKDQWDRPTPCQEWDVRALVAHVIATHGRVAASVGGALPGEVEPSGDLRTQWAAARAAIAERLADPERAKQTVGGMFGEQPFEMLVGRLLCADTLYHTWDLARATGQDDHLDGPALSAAQAFLEPLDAAIRRPGGFAPRIDPPPGADPQTAFLCFGGREP